MRMKMLLAMGISSSLLGAGAVALGEDKMPASPMADSTQLSSADRRFVTEAAQGGMAEVKLGKLAEDRAQSKDVKEFARKMIDDHSKANDQLKEIAQKKGLTIPAKLDSKDQMTYDRLAKLSGADFDRAYMDAMVRDHDTDVNAFKKQAEGGQDTTIKEFAAQTLPTLKEHQELARKIGTGGTNLDKMQK